ncbi:MAG: hypothetical protein K9M08_05200 [Pirellula sp.]|nr:hypothetical protein [Pirellula sp.]
MKITPKKISPKLLLSWMNTLFAPISISFPWNRLKIAMMYPTTQTGHQ